MKHGKKYVDSLKAVDKAKLYDVAEAVALSSANAKAKFDAVVNQVNSIINFYITGQTGDCTHDCSTCGGCH